LIGEVLGHDAEREASPRSYRYRAHRLLSRLSVDSFAAKLVGSPSRGQQQCVNAARETKASCMRPGTSTFRGISSPRRRMSRPFRPTRRRKLAERKTMKV